MIFYTSTFNFKKLFLIILYHSFCLCYTTNEVETTIAPSSCTPNRYINVDVDQRLFLTPLIRTGQIDKAQQLAHVQNEEMEKIAPSYSGYLTVNETYQSNMFFWYFPAKQSPESAPIMLWLNGGPGGASTHIVFSETGPFLVESTDKLLNIQNNSWHINHHMLYIDNPVGSGFSYTENEAGYAQNEIDVANNLYKAMKQFFTLFPNLQNNDFYIYGVSYGGKYAPALGYAIHTRNNNEQPKINLKGLVIDSGMIDTINQLNYSEFLYQIGLIDENGKEEFIKYESIINECFKDKDFECAVDNFEAMILGMNQSSLYYNYTGLNTFYNYLSQNHEKYDSSYEIFFNSTTVRRDIHVNNNYTFYRFNKKVYNYLRLDIVDSVADWVIELLSHYRIMLYDGQLDVICAYRLLENAIRTWKFSGSEEYKGAKRQIWRVDSDIAGYIKQGGNLTSVLVRNAGHGAKKQPKWTLDLIKRFIANDLLSD